MEAFKYYILRSYASLSDYIRYNCAMTFLTNLTLTALQLFLLFFRGKLARGAVIVVVVVVYIHHHEF